MVTFTVIPLIAISSSNVALETMSSNGLISSLREVHVIHAGITEASSYSLEKIQMLGDIGFCTKNNSKIHSQSHTILLYVCLILRKEI